MGDVEAIVSPLYENENINIILECPICFLEESTIYKMPCCKNSLCQKCYVDWHFNQRMGTCVFCRNIHLEYEINVINDINASRIRNSVNFQEVKVLFYLCYIFMTYCFLFVFFFFAKKDLKES